eukprot:gene9604-11295_t
MGEVVRYQELVHYVAPPAHDMQSMLHGLSVFWERTQGQSAVMSSAVMSFGFVYIHALADCNGRVLRFWVSDVLRPDGVVKEPMILPVSSLISWDPAERRAYNSVLDSISRPLMGALAGTCEFVPTPIGYPMGQAMAKSVWRYPDLTSHVLYLAVVLVRTIQDDMREESRYLCNHAQACAAIKDIIEMPDVGAMRILVIHTGKNNTILMEIIYVLSRVQH